MARKNQYRIAPDLKASTVRKMLRQGWTTTAIAFHFGFANGPMLYKRFGSAIVGVAKRGRPVKQVSN